MADYAKRSKSGLSPRAGRKNNAYRASPKTTSGIPPRGEKTAAMQRLSPSATAYLRVWEKP